MEAAVRPITALTFLDLSTPTEKPDHGPDKNILLLSGEGSTLKIFDYASGKVLAQRCVLGTENIHGIRVLPPATRVLRVNPEIVRLLIWGGRSVGLVGLLVKTGEGGEGVEEVTFLGFVQKRINDRILDGCFLPPTDSDHKSGSNDGVSGQERIIDPGGVRETCTVLLITSQNTFVKLRVRFSKRDGFGTGVFEDPIYVQGAGPRTLLCSANVSLDAVTRRIVVAGGSAFSKVFLWSCSIDHLENSDSDRGNGMVLHREFEGHQGSVYGVCLSMRNGMLESGMSDVLLASCSDDRTIRVWYVSDIDSRNPLQSQTEDRVASAMVHGSRLWGVRFLDESKNTGVLQILSSGEDGSLQSWRLTKKSEPISDGSRLVPILNLAHDRTFRFHSGKNLWACAVHESQGQDALIATGGADGRIVTYSNICETSVNAPRHYQFSVDSVSTSMKALRPSFHPPTSPRSILHSLQGAWNISRTIKSLNPTYPSGTLTGQATVESRPPTDKNFDDEYLYSEQGDYVTEQGFVMKASRQYVYRYRSDQDQASAWFVKTDGSGAADYLFHDMKFDQSSGNTNGGQSLMAIGHHLCIKDDYDASYVFHLEDQKLSDWRLKYSVKGPSKDYRADALYTRMSAADTCGHTIPCENPTKPECMSLSDSFKAYSWIDASHFVVTTNQGLLLLASLKDLPMDMTDSGLKSTLPQIEGEAVRWEILTSNAGLKSSSLISNVISHDVSFISGRGGCLLAYFHRSRRIVELDRDRGKSTYLQGHSVSNLLVSSISRNVDRERTCVCLIRSFFRSVLATLSLYQIHKSEQSVDIVGNCTMLLPAEFTITSSAVWDPHGHLLLGSRSGDILLYWCGDTTFNGETKEPLQVFRRVHTDAITSLHPMSGSSSVSEDTNTDFLLTTGRDSRYSIHKISSDNENDARSLKLRTLHSSQTSFGPNIEGTLISTNDQDKSHEIVVWGFRSTSFVVYNATRHIELMSIECGGAHRTWAYWPYDGHSDRSNLVWTKASTCNVYSQKKQSHRVVQSGGHGREIKAVAKRPDLRSGQRKIQAPSSDALSIIATGAEDTNIRLFACSSEGRQKSDERGYQCLRLLYGHTTGPQTLKWSKTGRWLFSAGGAEELFLWRIETIPMFGVGTRCVAKCPPVSKERDLRIMDFAILEGLAVPNMASENADPTEDEGTFFVLAVVYSDSSIRVCNLHYSNDGEFEFDLLLQGSYGNRCLTAIDFIYLGDQIWLYTGSTDGHLAFWHLPSSTMDTSRRRTVIAGKSDGQNINDAGSLKCDLRRPVHDSAIKSSISISLNAFETLILTGGDDQSLTCTIICAKQKPNYETAAFEDCSSKTDPLFDAIASAMTRNAHASAVTGLAYLGSETSTKAQGEQNTIAVVSMLYFASVGNDQRLKMWKVNIIRDRNQGQQKSAIEISMELVDDAFTSVADASGLAFEGDTKEEWGRLYVVGVVMECQWIEGWRFVTS